MTTLSHAGGDAGGRGQRHGGDGGDVGSSWPSGGPWISLDLECDTIRYNTLR
jgi:hypothetical protein